MGRQIHFYMLPKDLAEFLQFVQRDTVVVIVRDDSTTADLSAATQLDLESGKTLCFWNRNLLPRLHRTWIREPGYFRTDEFKHAILEFSPSRQSTWEGTPALIQGRLYGIFEEKPPGFEKWYNSLVRWIRSNYSRSRTSFGGYVGPAARAFYENGGYFLPQFLPPRTEVWIAELAKQHSDSKHASQL